MPEPPTGAIRRFAERRPLVFAAVAVVTLLLSAGPAHAGAVLAGAGPNARLLAGTAAHVAVAALLLGALRHWPEVHVRAPRHWRCRYLLAAPAAVVAVPYLSGPLHPPPLGWPTTLLEELGTGFAEEAVFRSVILGVLLRAWGGTNGGVRRAVVVQALLFGVAHVVLLDPVAVVSSTVVGLLFGAVVVRVGAVWPTMALHTIGNVGWQLANQESADDRAAAVLWATAMVIAVVAFTWFILRDGRLRAPIDDLRRTGPTPNRHLRVLEDNGQ